MRNLFNDIWNSFKNNDDGLSVRKLASFWAIVIVATKITYANTTNENVTYMVAIWLLFGSVCIGLITIPKLLTKLAEIRNGKDATSE